MKKAFFSICLLMALMLMSCAEKVGELSEIEYKKISPQDAQVMMSDDVIILDVRTPEEFDEGHIRNALLLPVHDIKEKAESVITDKNQTILVYCRAGGRSETAAKELIGMGYANVFDFGGIVDWTGEIVGVTAFEEVCYGL